MSFGTVWNLWFKCLL